MDNKRKKRFDRKIDMTRWSYTRSGLARAFAMLMTFIMIIGSVDIRAFATTVDYNIQEKVVISQVIELSEEVKLQELEVGGSFDSLNMPDSILAMVVNNDVEAEYADSNAFNNVASNTDASVLNEALTTTNMPSMYETEIPVTWSLDIDRSSRDEFIADTVGDVFVYTAILPAGYELSDGVVLPEITVVITDASTSSLNEINIIIDKPQIDNTPQINYIDADGQYIAEFTWYVDEDNDPLTAPTQVYVFEKDLIYTANIKLQPSDGFNLDSLETENIMVADAEGNVYEFTYNKESLLITLVFEELKSEPLAFEESVLVDGITITVTAGEGVFPDNAYLNVEQITEEEELKELSQAADKADGFEEKSDEETKEAIKEGFYAFDIKITDENGVELQPDESKGEVTVTFTNPNPDMYNTEDLSVYHVDEESGEAETLDVKTDVDREELQVEADSFSPFILRAASGVVTLYTGGGTILSGSFTKTEEGKYVSNTSVDSFPTPTMKDSTLQFAGWYKDGSYSNSATAPTAGGSYYAKWKRNSSTATASYMKYVYNAGYSAGIDARGIMNGSEVKTTFCNSGYALYYTTGTSSPSGKGTIVGGTTSGDPYINIPGTTLYVAQIATFEEPFVRYNYYVWNKGTSSVSNFNLASVADVQIGRDDYADLTLGQEDGNSYVIMSDGTHEFRLYYAGPNVNDVDTLWTGRYGLKQNNMYTNNRSNQSGIDSAIAFSWQNESIPANTVKIYSVLMGCGEPGTLTITRRYGFDEDGNGVVDNDEIQEVDEDDIIYAPDEIHKDGYYFLGWNTASDGSGTTYQPGDVISLDSDVILYAYLKPIENTAEITITLDDENWAGQNVSLYQNGIKKYDLIDKGTGLYYSDKVINGTYDIYLNGRKSDKTISFSATTTATRQTQNVTYKLLHITTNLEDVPSGAPGAVTLRTGSTVVYTPTGVDGIYTEYVLTSEADYSIFVAGSDTGFDIGVSDYDKTIDFYTVTVSITDDEPWTDASVVLRDSNNGLVATIAPATTNGNTVVYEKIVQKNDIDVYKVWVNGIDTHKTVQVVTGGCNESLTYYTATVNIMGGLENATITMTNGEESYSFNKDSSVSDETQDVYKAKHVLINDSIGNTEKIYDLSIAETSDATVYEIHSENKVLTLTYWKISFYRCLEEGDPVWVGDTYLLDGDRVPVYTTNNVKLSGYSFDFWSETPWDSTAETQNVAFDHSTPITRNYVLYANYAVPTVNIGKTIKTNDDGTVNGSGANYRMANLTISGFEKGEESIKYIFFTTVNTDTITVLDTTGLTILNGETPVTPDENGGAVSFTPVSDKVSITFDPLLSMAQAQDFLRNNVVITPTSNEEHVLIVEVADKSGEYVPANGVTAKQTTNTSAQELTSTNYGKTLSSGNYYLTKDATFRGVYSGTSGLSISSGATVYIYIPEGVTLTAIGGPASGNTGAGAGIKLPYNSTLIFLGEGSVVATGGNAASGSDGGYGNGGYSYSGSGVDGRYYGGDGGTGGAGGGGAGAGIGGAGGNGGDGGSRGSGSAGSSDNCLQGNKNAHGASGSSGSYGKDGGNCGYLYIMDSVTVKADGGSGNTSGGSGGSCASSYYDDWSYDDKDYHVAGAGGAGGGGGSGYSAYDIGSGGPGGGGGGGGGEGAVDYSNDSYSTSSSGCSCHGGGGSGGTGYVNGSSGAGTRDSSSYDDKWDREGGSGGSGGGSGSYGSKRDHYVATTATLNGTAGTSSLEASPNPYVIHYKVENDTASSIDDATYTFGKSTEIILPAYIDSNPDVVFLGWQISVYAKTGVVGSPFTTMSTTRYPAGAKYIIDPTTYGDIEFIAVTETVGGIRDDDETQDTFSTDDEAESYYAHNVIVTVDGQVDLDRGNIKIGDDIVAPGADGIYSVVSTTNDIRDITIDGKVVGTVAGNDYSTVASAATNTDTVTYVEYVTLNVKVTGKMPTSVLLRGEGAPSMADNGDATYTHEILKDEATDTAYPIYVDGENVNRTVSYGSTTIVPYYTATVNINTEGIELDEITAVELRAANGNSLKLTKLSDGKYAYTKLLDETAYTLYINGDKTDYTTDFKADSVIDATFTRYTTTVRTYLDGELFDKGTVRMDETAMVRVEEGVYELTTQTTTAMELSVDGVDVGMSITPGTENNVNYYTIDYVKSGAEDSNEEGTLPTDATYYLSGSEVTLLDKATLTNGGKTFSGWTIDGTLYKPGDKIAITATSTAYATWECTALTNEAEGFDVRLSDTEFTYNGQSQIPNITVYRGSTVLTADKDYVLTYSNTNKDAGRDDSDGGVVNTINAGTVTVTVTGIGDYTDAITTNYEINPKTIMVDGLEAVDKVYDGTTQVDITADKAELIGVVEGDEVILNAASVGNTYSPTARADKPVQIGEAQISGSAASNYVLETIDDLLVTIERKPLTVDMFDVSDVIYNGSQQKPEVVSTDNTQIDGEDVNLIDTSDYEITYLDNIHAGEATITVNADIGDDNGEGGIEYTSNYSGEIELTFTINKAELELKALPQNSVYGDEISDVSADYQITNGEIFTTDDETDLAIKAVTSVKKGYSVGNYENAVTISYNVDNSDYNITTIPADHSVTVAGDMDVTATGYTGIYDGESHGITVKPSGYMSDESFTIYYSKEELTADNYSTSGSTDMPECRDAGTYTVYYYVVSGNYTGQGGSQTVTIGQAPLKVTATDKTIIYGDDLTAIDDSALEAVNGLKGVNVSGLVESDKDKDITATVSYTSNDYEQYDDVGVYTVAPNITNESTDILKNYDITYVAGTLYVSPKEVNFSWSTPSAFTYNGSVQGVTATVTGIVNSDDVTVVYDTSASYKTSAIDANVNEESYIAKIAGIAGLDADNYTFDADNANAQCSWTIAKTDNEWSITPSIAGWTYGNVANTPIAAAKYGEVEYSYSTSNASDAEYTATIPNDAKAGTYYMKAYVPGTDNYFELVEIVEFDILEAPVEDPENPTTPDTVVYVTADNATLTYGDEVPSFTCKLLDVDGNPLKDANGEELTLEDIAQGSGEPTTVTVNYTTDYTSSSKVGNYTVVPSGLTAKEGYEIIYKPGTITVNPKEVSLSWTADSALDYTGAKQTVTATVSGTVNGDNIYVATYSDNEGETVGNYTAKALTLGGTNSNNYVLPADTTFAWSIAKTTNEFVISPTILSWYYGEEAATPNATAKFGDVTYQYRLKGSEVWTEFNTNSVPTLAGTYELKANVAAGESYEELASDVIEFNIYPAELVINAESQTGSYGAEIPDFTYSINELKGKASVDDKLALNITATTTATAQSQAGVYPVDITYTVNPNITVTAVPGTYTITKGTITAAYEAVVTADSISDSTITTTYDGQGHGVKVVPMVGDEKLDNAVVYYSETALDATNFGNGSTEPVTFNASGEHTAYYYIVVDNYEAIAGTTKVIINKKNVTVTANQATITYGEAADNQGVTYTGLVDGDTAEDLSLNPTYTYTKEAVAYAVGSDAGEYIITPSGLTADNYEFTYESGILTVNRKQLTADMFTVDTAQQIYDGTAKEPAITGSDKTGADTSVELMGADEYNVIYANNVNAGANTAAATITASENGNYTGSVEKTFGINPCTVTIAAKPANSAHNEELAELSYEITAGTILEADKAGLEIAVETTVKKDYTVGTYKDAIVVAYQENSNYEITTIPADYTITTGALTVTAQGYTGVYDGNEHGITLDIKTGKYNTYGTVYYSNTELTAANYESAAVTAPVYKDAGEYTVYYYVVCDNFEAVSGSAKVVIAKAPLAVSVPDSELTYGDAPDFGAVTRESFTYEGFVGEDTAEAVISDALTLSLTTTYQQYNDIGTYPITVEGMVADNYELYYVEGTLTVTPKTVTFEWPAVEYVYNGSEQAFVATINGLVNNDVVVAEYEENSEADITAAATSAGSYTAKVVTLSGAKAANYVFDATAASVSQSWTIEKATNSWLIEPTISSWTEGEASSIPVASAKYGEVEFAYSDDGGTTFKETKPEKEGSYILRAYVQESSNYEALVKTVEFTIASTESTNQTVYVKAAYNGEALSYGDAAPENTAYSYTLSDKDGNALTLDTVATGTVSYLTDYSQGSSAGDYTVIPTGLTGKIGYEIVYVPATFTVAKKEISLVWSASEFTYDGQEHTVIATVDSSALYSGDSILVTGYKVDTTASPKVTNQATDAGEYVAKAIAFDGNNISNYTINEAFASKSWTIKKADSSVGDAGNEFTTPLSISDWTYGESSSIPSVKAKYGDVTVKYSQTQDGIYEDEVPTQAGAYYAKAYVEETDNYAGLESDAVAFNINPVKLTIIADDISGEKGEDIKELTYTIGGEVVLGDELNITLTTTATKSSVPGSYPITISYTGNSNYQVNAVEGTYFIISNQADVMVTATGYTGIYDGQPHGITVNVFDSEGNVATGTTVYYSNTELTNNNYGSGSLSCPTRTDAGTTTIYYYVAVENGDPITGSKDIVIDKKEVTITANDVEIVYGDKPTNNGVAYDGFLGTDTAEILSLAPTYDIEYSQFGDVGAYRITPVIADTTNYSFNKVDGTLTVNKKPVTFTWKRPSYVYDGTPKSVTAEVLGTVNNDYVYLESTGYELYQGDSSMTKVGAYTTRAAALSGEKAGNYIIEDSETTAYYSWSITEGINYFTKAPSIASWTYGQAEAIPSAETVFGNSSDIQYLYSTSSNGVYSTEKPVDAGTYYMKAKMAATADYSEVESQPVSFQIYRAELTFTADTIFAEPGQAMKELTYTVSGTIAAGDVIDVDLTVDSDASDKDANGYLKSGSYDIIVTATDASGNYLINTVNGKYQVTDLELDIKASGVNTQYDGQYHGINVSVANTDGSQAENVAIYYSETQLDVDTDFVNAANATIESPTRKTVGTTTVYYYIVVGSQNSTSDVIYGSCDITITKKLLTVTANDTEIVVGDDPTNNGVSYHGFVTGEDENYLSGTLTYSYNYDKSQPVGSYLIIPSGLESENYSITYVSGNLMVIPPPAETEIIGVHAATDLVYNGEKHTGFEGVPTAGDGTVTEFIYMYKDSSGTVIGTGLDNAPTKAGDYTVVISIPEGNKYYKGQTEVDFTIEKKPITVVATNQAMLEGATFVATDTSCVGFVGSEGTTGEIFSTKPEIAVYDGENTKLTDVSNMTEGTYVLRVEGSYTLTDELSANYTIGATADGSLTVIPVETDNSGTESDDEEETGNTVVLDPENTDSGIVKTAVIKEDEAPDAKLEANLTVEKAEALLTDEEAEDVKDGDNALIYLLWDAADEEAAVEEKEAISKESEKLDAVVGIFLDVSLYKVVGDNSPVKITNVDGTKVEINVVLPDNLINTNTKVERTYYIIYEHEGIVKIIEPEYENGVLSFEADEFSIYSIVYKDVEETEPGNGGSGDTTEEPENGGSSETTEAPGNGGSSETTEAPGNGGSGETTEAPGNGGSGETTEAPGNGGSGETTQTPGNGGSGETTQTPENGETNNNSENTGNGWGGTTNNGGTDIVLEDDTIEEDDIDSEDNTEESKDDVEDANNNEKPEPEEKPVQTITAHMVDEISKETKKQLEDALDEIQKLDSAIKAGPYVQVPDEYKVMTGKNERCTFTIEIPEDIASQGRTYYLVTVDENGNIVVLQNESIVDGMLTFTGNVEGNYQLIYEDGGSKLSQMLGENGVLLDKNGDAIKVSTNHCIWHYLIFALALAGLIMTILLRRRLLQVITTAAISLIMVVLAIIGWCKWDIIFMLAGIAVMVVVITISMMFTEDKNDDEMSETTE